MLALRFSLLIIFVLDCVKELIFETARYVLDSLSHLGYETLNITHPLEPAIKLESTYKTYGSGKSKTQVLIGLNMEVPKGQIYGLLGKFN